MNKGDNMAKNKKKEKEKVVVETAADEVKKLTTILMVIIGVVCLFYIITMLITKNNSGLKYSKQDEISEISYDTILASDITTKSGDYYVLIYDKDDPYISLFQSYFSKYAALEIHDMVYYVDLNDALNQKYKGDVSSFDTSHFIFSGTTLLKMHDGSINSIYDTDEAIESYLKDLISTM